MREGCHYIGGRWVQGDGTAFQSTDPATGKITWEGRAAAADQVEQAIGAARGAFEEWAQTPIQHRMDLLQAFSQQLTENNELLAVTISRDTGKPLWESRAEVGAMIGKIDLSVRAFEERCRTLSRELDGARGVTRFKPHGVCAVMGPFNLPGHLPNGHIIPAVLAGNTVVFKPSELAAAVAHHMLKLWEDAGLPAGVINMVQGGRETGQLLSRRAGLDGLFFTGSYATGVALSRTFADRPEKILALEMGGNNPLVVWETSEPEAAVYMTVQSAFITAGQRCTCARRLVVPDNGDGIAFVKRLSQVTAGIRVGSYTDTPEPFMGPVITNAAAGRWLNAQQKLLDKGGKPIVEMKSSQGCSARLTPGLIDVTTVTDRADEEIFGPLLQVVRVADFDAAIREANHTRYGLSAALFSDRHDLYERFYGGVRAGVVNWNRQTTGASGAMPFGGVGASGNHRPSGYWAVDYCTFPVASIELDKLVMPSQTAPGIPR